MSEDMALASDEGLDASELEAALGLWLRLAQQKDLREFTRNAVLTLVSEQSIEEGGTSNIIQMDYKYDEK